MHIDNNINIEEISDSNESFNYKSYKDWISKITSYMKRQDNWREVSRHMDYAKKIYFDISKEYDSKSLLHGDFHYYNILKSENGYKIIDPKGVVENPIFDIPRYILNEFWDEKDRSKVDETIEKTFDIISDKLCIKRNILGKLLYIEGTMAICWKIEDGADINKKSSFLEMLEKLYEYVE